MGTATHSVIDDINGHIEALGLAARRAARVLAASDSGPRNEALRAMARHIRAGQAELTQANQQDLEAAEAAGLEAALMDRLALTGARIEAMAEGLEQIAALPDPVGAISQIEPMPSGIRVGRMRVPLGVVGII